MDYRNIIQHRVEAEKCFRRSRGTTNAVEILRWLKQADACLSMANKLGQEANEAETNALNGDSDNLDRQDTWH